MFSEVVPKWFEQLESYLAGNHLGREDVLVATVAICVGRHFLYNGLATSSVLTISMLWLSLLKLKFV